MGKAKIVIVIKFASRFSQINDLTVKEYRGLTGLIPSCFYTTDYDDNTCKNKYFEVNNYFDTGIANKNANFNR